MVITSCMSKTISNQQVVIVRLDRTIQVLNKAWIPRSSRRMTRHYSIQRYDLKSDQWK
jgi:hypothetical protein